MQKAFFSLLLTAAFTATPAYSQANTQAIEGRVLRAGTLEPIPNVQVRLTWPNASIPQTPQAIFMGEELGAVSAQSLARLTATYETRLGLAPGTLVPSKLTATTTDREGRFTFKDLGPGQYRVRVDHIGYFPPADIEGYDLSTNSLTTVAVAANQPTTRVDIVLTKGSLVTGRILDPNGQPIPGITVAANRLRYLRSKPLWDSVTTQTTDDRGEYRLFWLRPGEYFISAEARPAPGLQTSPSLPPSWDKTFYPGVTDKATVAPVIVRDGVEVNGINFSVRPAAPVFKISGTATNPFARANPATGVTDRTISAFVLAPREQVVMDRFTPPQLQNAIPAQARPNGEFEIRNVPAGSYDLYPVFQDSESRRYMTTRTPVEVRNSDVTGLTIVLTSGVPLSGEVVVEGPAPQAIKLDSIRLSLWSADTLPGSLATTIPDPIPVDASGKFNAGSVPEARYRFVVSGLPETAYVANIRQRETSVYDSGFTLDSLASPVQVVVNPAGGTIEGIVMSAGNQKPVARAYVTLVPPAERGQNIALFKTALTDDSGRFTMKGIAPGSYTLFSFDAIPWGAGLSAEFHVKYRERGRTVTVEAGKTGQAQLDLISVPGLTASPPTGR
jgi:protocatechuate 3,4-dioxygenase beta subunit